MPRAGTRRLEFREVRQPLDQWRWSPWSKAFRRLATADADRDLVLVSTAGGRAVFWVPRRFSSGPTVECGGIQFAGMLSFDLGVYLGKHYHIIGPDQAASERFETSPMLPQESEAAPAPTV